RQSRVEKGHLLLLRAPSLPADFVNRYFLVLIHSIPQIALVAAHLFINAWVVQALLITYIEVAHPVAIKQLPRAIGTRRTEYLANVVDATIHHISRENRPLLLLVPV